MHVFQTIILMDKAKYNKCSNMRMELYLPAFSGNYDRPTDRSRPNDQQTDLRVCREVPQRSLKRNSYSNTMEKVELNKAFDVDQQK